MSAKRGRKMVLNRKEREMIYRVHCLMKKEAQCRDLKKIRVKQTMRRTAEATGTSVATVRRIVKKARENPDRTAPALKTPGRKRRRRFPVTGVEVFSQGLIRRTIHNYHVTNKELPTVKKLRCKLQQDMGYQGSDRSLRRIVKNLGFSWKRTETKKKLLIEKSSIRLRRIEFLEQIKMYRQAGRPIIYIDESYIDSWQACPSASVSFAIPNINPADPMSAQNPPKLIRKSKPKPKHRLGIILACGKKGFIPHSLHTFKTTKSGDENMDYESYERWLTRQLIPNLPPNSVVIVDNASYNKKEFNPPPIADARKSDMQAWLNEKGVRYSAQMLKPQLHNLIKHYTYQQKQFKIDKILAEHNHNTLHLPPYHSDLNPIQTAWTDIKGYVASRNLNAWNVSQVTDLVKERVYSMGEKEWKFFFHKVASIENEYRRNDLVVDMMTETFIIKESENESESSSDESSDGDDCSGDDDDEDDDRRQPEPPPVMQHHHPPTFGIDNLRHFMEGEANQMLQHQ